MHDSLRLIAASHPPCVRCGGPYELRTSCVTGAKVRMSEAVGGGQVARYMGWLRQNQARPEQLGEGCTAMPPPSRGLRRSGPAPCEDLRGL
jgi:hypothetical protein